MGLVRAMAADLKTVAVAEPQDLLAAIDEINRQSDYAMEALRVIERRSSVELEPVHLGAWAWALRLWVRTLAVGDLAAAPKVSIALAPAIDAGVAMVRALHPTRPVMVDLDGDALRFESGGDAHDDAALARALDALNSVGLDATRHLGPSCRVSVRG